MHFVCRWKDACQAGNQSGVAAYYLFEMKITATVAALLSVLPVPAYAQPPCTSTVVGHLRMEQFQSTSYGDQRTLRVWLPADYDAPENAQKR